MRKTLITSLAALGVAGLIGGGTLAAWSDTSTTSTGAGAGILALEVSSTGGSGATTGPLGFGNLAPGENKIQEIFVASSDGDSVPNATLSLTMGSLVDSEDAGTFSGCTTNSELIAEGGGTCGSEGEFADEAWIQIRTKPAPAVGACGGGGYTSATSPAAQTQLENVPGLGVLTLDTDVAPGEGVCVRIELGLPDGTSTNPGIDFAGSADSTNASQGDEATFDLTFDLVQNV